MQPHPCRSSALNSFPGNEFGNGSPLDILIQAERAEPWAARSRAELPGLLLRVSRLFYEHGESLASETARQMGVSEAEVWLQVVFPSVWGVLSTFDALKRRSRLPASSGQSFFLAGRPVLRYGGSPAIRSLPGNLLERLLLPGFEGYVLLADSVAGRDEMEDAPKTSPAAERLALCLLPFNLASIGVLDIVHLLCHYQLRVVAKLSEKADFLRAHLERILAPLIEAKCVVLVSGGPAVGAWLAAQPEFGRVHLTGSAGTATEVAKIAERAKLSCELGGVTPAIVLPDSISTKARLRHTARQIAFGALANNGQHCVSTQVVFVPESFQEALQQALWAEMSRTSGGEGGHTDRKLIDKAASHRLEVLLEDASQHGATVTPCHPRARGDFFPVCLINEIDITMRLFREEAFGPVVGIMGLPEGQFGERALRLANSTELAGDLAASLYTSNPKSPDVQRLACALKQGVVTVNTYPGVAFATSLPWGAGTAGLSGWGWVHNYHFLPERTIRKVVLTAPLGRKGWGPLRWEDPWLPNVSDRGVLNFAKSLVRLTLAFFQRDPHDFVFALSRVLVELGRRDLIARIRDRSGE